MRERHAQVSATRPEAPAAAPAGRPLAAPSVDWRTALRLAWLRAVAMLAGLVVVAGAVVLVLEFNRSKNQIYLAGAGGLVLVVGTFAVALWGYTSTLRRALWQIEKETGQDLDGDGYTGPPLRQRVRLVAVNKGGQRQAPEALNLDDSEDAGADWPILDGFELDPVDVAAFVSEANRRGLTRSAWLQAGQLRHRLPSGGRVTRGVYDRVTSELVRLGWAEDTGAGLALAMSVNEILIELRELAG